MGGIDPNVKAVYLNEKQLQLIFKNPKLARKIHHLDSLYLFDFNFRQGNIYQKYLINDDLNIDSAAHALQPIKDSLKLKYNLVYDEIKESKSSNKSLLLRAIRMRLINLNTSSYVDSVDYYITTGNKRNRLMAENLEYVLDSLYPNKKVIVWMHNGHIKKKGISSITKYLDSSTVANSFIIGLFARTGKRGGGTAPIRKVKHPWFNSLERKYGAKKAKGVFYPISMIKSKKWIYGPYHVKRDVTKLYDGIIILNDVTPSYMLRFHDTFKCELKP